MKNICRILFLVLVLCFSVASVYAADSPKTMGKGAMEGTVTVIPLGDCKLHSYQAPAKGAFVTTQIIETQHRLIVIDTQYLRPYAKEVRGYINSLHKPIERVIISHSHPDHWFGSEYFQDAPIYASAEVKTAIEQTGDAAIQRKRQAFGELVTDKKVVPAYILNAQTETIDGVTMNFVKVQGTEASEVLMVELPKQHALIAQDVVYNRIHAFLGQNDISGWLNAVQKLKEKKYELVLAGHGLPSNGQVLADLERYLLAAKSALAESSNIQTFKSKMLAQYPLYQGEGFLDLSGFYLFK